jgi:AraC family transcriptional regulator of arabinose operon
MSERQWNIWSQQVKSRLGSLVEIGEVLYSTGRMTRYRYLRRHALVVVTRGEGHYEDERGRNVSLSAGDWVLVFPELGHCYGPQVTGGWDEVYVMFEGPVFEIWRQQGLLDPNQPTGRLAEPKRWLEEFRGTVLDEKAAPLTRMCSFQSLLAAAVEGSNPDMESRHSGPAWFADACRLLARPGTDAEQVAKELGIAYESFRRQFRDHAGVPPHRYHRQQLVNLAARMLDSTDMKAAEIARTLGFCDEAYFSRVFKKLTGRSPRAYRKRQEMREKSRPS